MVSSLILGLALSAAGVVALTGIDAGTGYADLAWRLAIFGVGLAITMTTVSTAAINAAPWHQAGMAAATNTALRQYGGALGPALLGVVFSDRLAAGATPTEAVHTALVVNAVLLGSVLLITTWGATQWTAWRLGFQAQLGTPWFELAGWPVYYPPAFFWWWYFYDAYAPPIFVEGAVIAASGGFISIAVAIATSIVLQWSFSDLLQVPLPWGILSAYRF